MARYDGAVKVFRILPLLLPLFGMTASAWAGPTFYVDAGAGYVNLQKPSPFFNGSLVSGSASGYGLGIGLWTTFTSNTPALNFQLGLQDRYTGGADSAGTSFGLNIPYLVARLQASLLYLGFGYSPYVSRSVNGTTSFGPVTGASSMMGQAGVLLPVTPKFSFGIEGSYQTVNSGYGASPSPIIAVTGFMRFYFGFGAGGAGGGGHTSGEFRGWRYPFGKDLN